VKRLLATALLTAGFAGWLSQGHAEADLRMTYAQGSWMTAAGRSDHGTPMCAAATAGTEGRRFQIKWFADRDGLTVHIFKDGWSIPEGSKVDVVFQIDRASPWSATARGSGNSVMFHVAGEQIVDFVKEMAFGSTLRVGFPSGNEQPWIGSLAGSGGAIAAMGRCIEAIKGKAQPTQPYAEQPRQPAQPTQPFMGVIDPTQQTVPEWRT